MAPSPPAASAMSRPRRLVSSKTAGTDSMPEAVRAAYSPRAVAGKTHDAGKLGLAGEPQAKGHRGHGRLQGAGVGHGRLVALPVDFAQGQSRGFFGQPPQFGRLGRGFGQGPAHATFLGALPGKEHGQSFWVALTFASP